MKLSENLHSVYVIVFENLGTSGNEPYVKQYVMTHHQIITDKIKVIGQYATWVGAKPHHIVAYARNACNNRGYGKAGVTKLLKGVNNFAVSHLCRRKLNYKLVFRVKPRGLKVNYRVIKGKRNDALAYKRVILFCFAFIKIYAVFTL